MRAGVLDRLGRADDGARIFASVSEIAAAVHRREDAAVDGAEPAHVLRRGYARVTDGSGRPVHTAAAARAAAGVLHLTFADGSVAVVIHTQPTITGDQP